MFIVDFARFCCIFSISPIIENVFYIISTWKCSEISPDLSSHFEWHQSELKGYWKSWYPAKHGEGMMPNFVISMPRCLWWLGTHRWWRSSYSIYSHDLHFKGCCNNTWCWIYVTLKATLSHDTYEAPLSDVFKTALSHIYFHHCWAGADSLNPFSWMTRAHLSCILLLKMTATFTRSKQVNQRGLLKVCKAVR